MRFSTIKLFLVLASVCSALPSACSVPSIKSIKEEPTLQCSQPRIRKEWRAMSSSEQNAYMNALQCLKDAPSKGTAIFSNLQNRYDDFVALHINATRGGQDAPSISGGNITGNPTIYGVHGVGVFLPWHRYAIWTYESVLRSECNYNGSQPYWDWTLDNPASNGSIATSPVLQAFGGDGDAGTGCIQSGPFNSSTYLNIGPVESLDKNPRCLKRNISGIDFDYSGAWDMIYPPTMSRKSYVQVQAFIDDLSFVAESDKPSTGALQNPHSMGHAGIGGDLQDVYSSPNDPLFWMHHTQLDYMWAMWQKADPARLFDMGGSRTVEGLGPGANETEQTALDTPVWMGFLNDDVLVREVMDTINGDGKGVLCYEYQDSPSLAGRNL